MTEPAETAPSYKMRGYRNYEEVLAAENARLLELEQSMLFQPTEEAAPSDQFMAPIDASKPDSKQSDITDKAGETATLRNNLKFFMSDDNASTLITMLPFADIQKLNSQWASFVTRIKDKKNLMPSQMKAFIDSFFKAPNFGFFKDEV